ncbi:MAG: bifunctional diaminohydroxyphosphoribosylaminopyrimidine deaminase/5-amino-6-(5-phosphoribosylamino)uracil reductase RibD [bacterium]
MTTSDRTHGGRAATAPTPLASAADAGAPGRVSRAQEDRYRALLAELAEAAREFRYQVAPNPCVGAALLRGDVEVARAFHTVWGGGHAEVEALRAVQANGGAANGFDTLVVTLEPCSSHGKTPPCVDAVLASSASRVVVGARDPDPRHQGRGLETLRAAGREVLLFEGAAPLAVGSEHFLAWIAPERMRRRVPWTIAKWAQTRSGQLTPPEGIGDGRWISSPASRAEVHQWRGQVDAIVTGVGTVLADDPRLSVRGAALPAFPPARVVLDSELRTPPSARLFERAGEAEAAGPVFVLGRAGAAGDRRRALEARGAVVVDIEAKSDGRLSLARVQAWLWSNCVRRMLLEAGPTLLERWIAEGRVDQWLVYEGAIEHGRGPSLLPRLREPALRRVRRRALDGDVVIEAFSS